MNKELFDLISIIVFTAFIIYFDTESSKVMLCAIYLGGTLTGIILERYFSKKGRKKL